MKDIDTLNIKFDKTNKIEYIQDIIEVLGEEDKKLNQFYKKDVETINNIVKIVEKKVEKIEDIDNKNYMKYDILKQLYQLQRKYYSHELRQIRKTSKDLQKVMCSLGIIFEFAKSKNEVNKEIECKNKINYHIKFGKEMYDRYSLLITQNTLEKENLLRKLQNDEMIDFCIEDLVVNK